jgi:hypothetical protein
LAAAAIVSRRHLTVAHERRSDGSASTKSNATARARHREVAESLTQELAAAARRRGGEGTKPLESRSLGHAS